MGLLGLFLIAAGLSMDAFAVSACIGLGIKDKKSGWKKAVSAGLYFGGAQFIMPVAGYFAGASVADKIAGFSGYIAFIILAFIGGKMIRASFDKSCENKPDTDLCRKKMLILAAATSIDALFVGVGVLSFNFSARSIFFAAGFIGAVTFILSASGVKLGGLLGLKLKNKAEFAGGLVLVLIGVRILLEHTGII